MRRLTVPLFTLLASALLTACVARGPMKDANIARNVKEGLQPGDAWIVTRLDCPQCGHVVGRVDFWQGEAPDATDGNLVRQAKGTRRAGLPFSASGKPVVTIVRAGRITFDSVTSGNKTGRGQIATAIIRPGTITYIGDVQLKFSPSGTHYALKVTDNPATVMELRQSQPALFDAYPLEVAILSPRAGITDIDTSRMTRVDENRATIQRAGQSYLLDTFIVPFQQPYHVLVRHSGSASLDKSDAESLALQYIQPRGCTRQPTRRPDLDRANTDRTQWLIGIEC